MSDMTFTRIDGGLRSDFFIMRSGFFKVHTSSYPLLVLLIILVEMGYLVIFQTIAIGGLLPFLLVFFGYRYFIKRRTKRMTIEELNAAHSAGKAEKF